MTEPTIYSITYMNPAGRVEGQLSTSVRNDAEMFIRRHLPASISDPDYRAQEARRFTEETDVVNLIDGARFAICVF